MSVEAFLQAYDRALFVAEMALFGLLGLAGVVFALIVALDLIHAHTKSHTWRDR